MLPEGAESERHIAGAACKCHAQEQIVIRGKLQGAIDPAAVRGIAEAISPALLGAAAV